MVTSNCLVIVFGVVLGCAVSTSAFFLNWGSAEPEPIKIQQPQWPVTSYYQQRLYQQPQYTTDNNIPMSIPAIPIQVPLQAQLAPAASIQNVQLVPCLCPVAQDIDGEKNVDPTSVFVSQIKPQQPQR